MLGCATRPSLKGGWFLFPPERAEGAPPEDSSPASEDLSTTRWESQSLPFGGTLMSGESQREGSAMSLPPPDRAHGWYIEGQLLECFPFDSCA